MTAKDTYLTVDLDYWDTEDSPSAGAVAAKVLSLGIPVSVYIDHHLVLKDFKGEAYTKVVNIDQHDDLTADLIDKLDEGNWASRIPFREAAIYEWRYPPSGGFACDGEEGAQTWGLGDARQKDGPFEVGIGACNWKRIQRRSGLDGIEFEKVAKASFILSPAYVGVEKVKDALTILASVPDRVSCSTRVRAALKRVLREQSPLFNKRFLTSRRRANPSWCKSAYGLSWA